MKQEVDDQTVMHAAQVVERCFTEKRGPADVMARMPALRLESSAMRAQVSRIAAVVIASHRRLRFALQEECPRHPLERARAYVLVSLAESGHRLPAHARDLPTAEVIQQRLQAMSEDDERFAIRHSIPDWLVPRFREAFAGEADAVLQSLAKPAPRTLRVNLLRLGSRDDLIARLAGEGIEAVAAEYAQTAVHVLGTQDLFQTQAYADGCFEQQDEASQLAVLATAPPRGGKVLDMCCGSGGKTLGLASLLQNRGAVFAGDVHAARVREMRQRLRRAGADNVQPLHLDGTAEVDRNFERLARHSDRILIDAPCSGSGSWRRRPEARWNIDESDLAAMQQTQQELLMQASEWLRPGARLVYATCSLLPSENEQQIRRLCGLRPDLESVRVTEILGGTLGRRISDESGTWLSVRPDRHGCDGFFLAVLRRK